MKARLCAVQRRQRRVSAVHLTGLSIVTRVYSGLDLTMQQTHNNDVLMHALLTPVVFQLSGMTAGSGINAG